MRKPGEINICGTDEFLGVVQEVRSRTVFKIILVSCFVVVENMMMMRFRGKEEKKRRRRKKEGEEEYNLL